LEEYFLTLLISPFCFVLLLSVSVFLYPECTTYLEIFQEKSFVL